MPRPKPPLTVKNFITRVNTLINAAKKWPSLTAEDTEGEGVDLMAIIVEYHRWATREDHHSESYIGSDLPTKHQVRCRAHHLVRECENTYLAGYPYEELSTPREEHGREEPRYLEREREYFGLDDFNPFSFPELQGEPLGLWYMITTCYERSEVPRGMLSEVAIYYMPLQSARYMLQSYRPILSISGHRFYGGALRNHVKLAAVYDRKRVYAWRRDKMDALSWQKISMSKKRYLKHRKGQKTLRRL